MVLTDMYKEMGKIFTFFYEAATYFYPARMSFCLVKIKTGAQVLRLKKCQEIIFQIRLNFRVTCTDRYAIGVKK
ncbi:MAG: hypothetical protein SRB2_03714 [Desulfobacteraceae bacterium Eth-SRB2]|nr:MAG: hypothetical protein SRB2_03714 [Desulfobacteraceae bacterium Eth-SRB2]